MLNLKKFSKRTLRRDRNDDLSMLTGGRPSISLGGPRSGVRNRNRVNHDQKLKQQFLNARATALVLTKKGMRPPKNSFLVAPCAHKLSLLNPTSAILDPTSSVIFPIPPTPNQQHENVMEPPKQQSSGVTLNSIPSLVKTSQSRQAMLAGKPRGILKPSTSNQLYCATPQTQYWSTYANTGGSSKPRISSTVYNMSTTRGQNKPTSTWKIHSSAPITREDASLLQREMISTMSGGSSSFSSSAYFSSTPVPAHGVNNRFGKFAFSTPRQMQPIPSLVRSVQPPAPSPIFPIAGAPSTAWDTPTSASQAGPPNGCGVHQSEWMDRSKCMAKAPTKQYSMEQIIDILCGFATPDSIMADQLFKPLPTPTQPKVTPLKSSDNRLNATSRMSNEPLNNPWNVSHNSKDKREENSATGNDDDGETSVYFRTEKSVNVTSSVKKKQVSFLTDSDGKLCVNEFVFNPFSQEWLSSNSSTNSTEKENMNPNFERVLPATPRANANDIFSIQQSPTTANPNFLPQRDEQTFNPLLQSQCDETTSPYFNNILPAQPAPLASQQHDLNQRLSNEPFSAYQSNILSQPKAQPFNLFEDHLSDRSSGSHQQKENVESNLETILSLPSPAPRDAQTFMNDLSSIFNSSQLPELQGQLFTQDFLNSCSSNMNFPSQDKSMAPNSNPVQQAGVDMNNLFGSSEMSGNNSFNVSETLHQLLNSETFLF